MSKFIYDVDIPEIILPDLKRYLEPLECLIPAWCTQVFVGYAGGDAGEDAEAVAQCSTQYPYRFARITFRGRWTNQPDHSKVDISIHEVLHIAIAPLFNFACEKLKQLAGGEERLKTHLLSEADERGESVTQDLTGILKAILFPALRQCAFCHVDHGIDEPHSEHIEIPQRTNGAASKQ